ncbi:MAG: acylphosphatase [Chloroflexota bacterium]
MSRRVHVTVRGRVQNVGFRQFTARRATRLALSGWVRNTPDEQVVELEAEGDDAAIEALTAALRRGPPGARVETIEVRSIPPMEDSSGFHVTF